MEKIKKFKDFDNGKTIIYYIPNYGNKEVIINLLKSSDMVLIKSFNSSFIVLFIIYYRIFI